MHIGGGDHRAVSQPRLAVHADVQLHAKVPLFAFARLVHLGVARLGCVLGGAGRTNNGRIHDGAGVDLQAPGLQFLPHLGKQGFAELVLIEHFTKLQQRGGVGYALAAQINTGKAAQAGAALEGFLTGQIGQVEPVLDEVDAQHALKTNGRTAIAGLGVVRLNHLAQC